MCLAEISSVSGTSFMRVRRSLRHLSGAAAFVANLAVLPEDIERIGAAVRSAALRPRHATANDFNYL